MRIIFVYNATRNLIILGQPAFFNMNLSISYERGVIGLSGGKDLTPKKTDFSYRIGIMIGVFTFLAIAAFLLNWSVDKARD